MADIFQGYPQYNFSLSGLTGNLLTGNTNYYYGGYQNGKPFWTSLDGSYKFYFVAGEDNEWFFSYNNISIGNTALVGRDLPPWGEDLGWEYGGVNIYSSNFTLVPFNKSNIVVSGIDSSGVEGIDLNGTYVLGTTGFGNWWGDAAEEEVGINLRRPFYVKTNGYSSENFGFENWSYIIRYSTDAGAFAGDRWWLYNNQVAQGFLFSSEVNAIPYYPTDVTPWVQTSTITGTPVLTFASSQNTFGLPTESVALITSRFGSVANFLRLRNLGQI
jgi:hypothetical protein